MVQFYIYTSSTGYDDVLRHPSPESVQEPEPQDQIQQDPEQHEAEQEAEPLLEVDRVIRKGIVASARMNSSD